MKRNEKETVSVYIAWLFGSRTNLPENIICFTLQLIFPALFAKTINNQNIQKVFFCVCEVEYILLLLPLILIFFYFFLSLLESLCVGP